MLQEEFTKALEEHRELIEEIRLTAHKVHALVNQHYDETLPYSVHLDGVANAVVRFGAEVVADARDVVPLMFGAYFHDSIEDARLTYNNVLHLAEKYMDGAQALMAAEIVYALTNEKGRNRSERANEKYYLGIRSTPYAPLCKVADRIANVTYSVEHVGKKHEGSMKHIYAAENPHFMAGICVDEPSDKRLEVPKAMVEHLLRLLS